MIVARNEKTKEIAVMASDEGIVLPMVRRYDKFWEPRVISAGEFMEDFTAIATESLEAQHFVRQAAVACKQITAALNLSVEELRDMSPAAIRAKVKAVHVAESTDPLVAVQVGQNVELGELGPDDVVTASDKSEDG